MKVLFFAQSRQITACDAVTLSTDRPLSEEEFWLLLIKTFPGLASLRGPARLARHETYLQSGELLYPDDEIAVIPPVSGG